MNVMKRFLVFWMLSVGMLFAPTLLRAQVAMERSNEVVAISGKQYYMHHVKAGETLYSLTRAYQVSEEELRRLNPELNELGLQADMVLAIPVVADGYYVYTVQEAERTKRLLRRLQVDEEEFRRLNPSVGVDLFVGQRIMIPVHDAPAPTLYEPEETVEHPKPHVVDTIYLPKPEPQADTLEEEKPGVFALPAIRPDTCYPSPQNAHRLYHVALLVPLYLDDIEHIDVSRAQAERTKNSRAMRFLQFYEGFMMAVDSMTQRCGMRLELTVIDVHENEATARAAVDQLRDKPIDLIVGPFFSRSFSVVEEYALRNHIPTVNPMSERGSIIVDAPNVIKLKPSPISMVNQLADLIQTRYPKAKVSLISDGNSADTVMMADLERVLDSVVSGEVSFTNREMHDLIVRESVRRNMGRRVLSTLEVEGQIFSTRSLEDHPDGTVYFQNQFQSYSVGDINAFVRGLSSARDNVLIAYGKDIVFATQILNTINRSAQDYPITLIGLPSWSEFDNLLVPNLLNMNAIYFDDHFEDYNDSLTLNFVDDFRRKYDSEPIDYAFEGFDVGWYFLNVLMQYGPRALGCLPYIHMPMLHTRYYFTKSRYNDGLENRYWNMFQYDRYSVELKPVLIYSEEE